MSEASCGAAGAPSLGSAPQARPCRWLAPTVSTLGDGGELRQRLLHGLGAARRHMHGDGAVIGQAAHQVFGGAVGDDAAAC